MFDVCISTTPRTRSFVHSCGHIEEITMIAHFGMYPALAVGAVVLTTESLTSVVVSEAAKPIKLLQIIELDPIPFCHPFQCLDFDVVSFLRKG